MWTGLSHFTYVQKIYKKIYNARATIVLLIKHFFWSRSRCRCRRGLLKLSNACSEKDYISEQNSRANLTVFTLMKDYVGNVCDFSQCDTSTNFYAIGYFSSFSFERTLMQVSRINRDNNFFRFYSPYRFSISIPACTSVRY